MNKKFFTILFTAAVTVLAFGQVPMVVKGQVNNVGDLKSQGNVLLRASSTGTNAEILNYGKLVLERGITFTSDDNADGLLYNNFDGNGEVEFPNRATTYGEVKVEKTLTIDEWYYLSFPFDIVIDSIKIEGYPTWNVNSGQLVIVENSAERVTSGIADNMWKRILTSSGKVLQAGVGYGIGIDGNKISGWQSSHNPQTAKVIFPAADETTVRNIYDKTNNHKRLPYVYYQDKTDLNPDPDKIDKAYGWYAMGTAQTYNYHMYRWNVSIPLELSSDLINNDVSLRSIYHFDAANKVWRIQALDYPMYGTSNTHDGMYVSPYAAFIVQMKPVGANREQMSGAQYFEFEELYSGLDPTVTQIDYRRSKRNIADNNFIALTFQADNSTFSDHLWIGESESDTNDYVPGEDDLKLFNGKFAEFYTLLDNKEVSINRFHKVDADIPLGVKKIAEGNYTIGMPRERGFENSNIYLLDRTENVIHNLSESAYHFHYAAADVDNNRFVIRIGKDITDINAAVNSKLSVWAQNHTVFVQGLQNGDKVAIYDITGQLLNQSVAKGSEVSYPLGKTGVFVVKVNGSLDMVTKVINK
jgi:hypothetical protein